MTREQGRGKREEVLGNFTFRYIFRFFRFTYLNLVLKTMKRFIYMGYGVNKLIFGITGTEEPNLLNF